MSFSFAPLIAFSVILAWLFFTYIMIFLGWDFIDRWFSPRWRDHAYTVYSLALFILPAGIALGFVVGLD